MSTVEQSATRRPKPKSTTYSVNGEPQTTEQRKLTVRAILTNAGFTPVENYRLIRTDGNKTLTDLDREEPIHDGEQFNALFNGPTPVS